MTNLYYIRNAGCDDTTSGLARMTDEQFEFFKDTIENLNKNSTYQCMPRIYVYKIDDGMIREATEDDYPENVLTMDGHKYVFENGHAFWNDELEEVIGRER